MADPTQQTGATDDDSSVDMSQGYCIEINVAANNKITVSVEPASEESSEESGSDDGSDDDTSADGSGDSGDDEDAQPVANIREALKLVMDIYQNAGQMQDTGEDQSQMSSGYKS